MHAMVAPNAMQNDGVRSRMGPLTPGKKAADIKGGH